jgi:hypothetical protein
MALKQQLDNYRSQPIGSAPRNMLRRNAKVSLCVRGFILRRLVVELLHSFAHTAALVVAVDGIKASI